MPLFRENPRGGTLNKPVENGGEIHLPCVVLVDTSGSMASVKDQLRQGLTEMVEALDDQARGRVEFCVITFDDDARVLVPFGPAYDYEVPRFDCDGMTAMHAAVELGLNELEARKQQYKANCTSYFRPWMFMLTDGGANDEDNGSFERLIQAQQGKHCTFFPVGIGNEVDKELLKKLKLEGYILTASKENFQNAFVWLSNSVSQTSNTRPGQKVKLDNPVEYQMEVEA